MCGTCCVHVLWSNMLKMENCTYALVANLLYAVLLRWPSVNSCRWSNTVGDPLSLLCQLAALHEHRSLDLAIGSRDNPQSLSVILTRSVCLLSWVTARRKPLTICMLPKIMARLCARDWVLARFPVFGHGLIRFSLLGHGLVRVSLLGMDW